MSRLAKFLTALVIILAAGFPAAAHTRVFVGLGFWPLFPFYEPYYYYPPPIAYYGAYYGPVYYYPFNRPVYYEAPYQLPAAQAAPTVNCMRFKGDATDDQTGEPFFGTACLQADGRWHIVGGL